MQDAAIVAEGLTIMREKVTALDAVTFQVRPGVVTGLIGPSGSGKTTLIRAIIGAQAITKGKLAVLGQPAGSKALRTRMGYVAQTPAVYEDLTVLENLRYFAVILGVGEREVAEVIRQVDLHQHTKQIVRSLSGGEQARVSLAIALLGNADLLVLDEPTVGLDPLLRKHLWQLFAELAAQGKTLLISSHVMDEAEQCPELLLLRDGQVLNHSSKQELLQRTSTKTVEAAFLKLVEQGTKHV